MTTLMWFRRDLRLEDNPALTAALEAGENVVPVFCFDPGITSGRHASGNRTAFMLECLDDLRSALRSAGGDLVVRQGKPDKILSELAKQYDVTEVYTTADISPYARRRDQRVGEALAADGITLHLQPGLLAVDDIDGIKTQNGGVFSVFTPFYRRWEAMDRRPEQDAPSKVTLPAGLDTGTLPSLASLGLEATAEHRQAGGRTAGLERLEAFLAQDVKGYTDNHDQMGADRTSRLSAYLHFGCLSPREIEERLPRGQGAAALARQLAWRDFYHYVLYFYPDNSRREYQERYRDFPWSYDEDLLKAWQDGQTGYPIVDAAMRQLKAEGWMHNRGRLIVGSFLTKDLGLDWRLGERYFMQQLIDGDQANNNGNWQWIASVGVDPAPPFRRMYNPTKQQERYDPDNSYVKRYVPELRDVPDKYLREPWLMPEDVQAGAGCRIGQDYPEPVVDHKLAREAALERYRR